VAAAANKRIGFVEFDNKISWMDIVAIIAALMTGLLVFFDVKQDVILNTASIKEVKANLLSEIQRVDSNAERDRNEILQAINMVRSDASEGRRRIEDKLDRLIERKLDGGS
jgi:hypothetical protein